MAIPEIGKNLSRLGQTGLSARPLQGRVFLRRRHAARPDVRSYRKFPNGLSAQTPIDFLPGTVQGDQGRHACVEEHESRRSKL